MDKEVFQAMQRFETNRGHFLPSHMESIKTLCLYGNGSGLGVEPINFEWVSWLCHQLNMLGELYLSDLRIDNLFRADLKIAAVSTLIMHSRRRRKSRLTSRLLL